MTVVPQQYTLQCVYSGFFHQFKWYYDNTEFNCGSPQNGYSCNIGVVQTLYNSNSTKFRALSVTWYAEKINSGIFSQSNNNGDHVHRCYEKAHEIRRNRYLTVTGKYFYNYRYMMSCLILSAPGFTPSPPTLVNKTATTITVSWTPVPSDADGYVVNVTSNTHTMTQQVKGGSLNETILKGLIPVTTYDITEEPIKIYWDLLVMQSVYIHRQVF